MLFFIFMLYLVQILWGTIIKNKLAHYLPYLSYLEIHHHGPPPSHQSSTSPISVSSCPIFKKIEHNTIWRSRRIDRLWYWRSSTRCGGARTIVSRNDFTKSTPNFFSPPINWLWYWQPSPRFGDARTIGSWNDFASKFILFSEHFLCLLSPTHHWHWRYEYQHKIWIPREGGNPLHFFPAILNWNWENYGERWYSLHCTPSLLIWG